MKKDSRSVAVALALAAASTSITAFAQKPKKKTPAAAPAESTAAETPPTDTAATAPPAESATPATTAGTGAATTTEPTRPATESTEGSMTDVFEKPGEKYYFLGLRYRGTIVPQFMVNLFVDEGATFYSNTIGVELDMRKDNFSLIPAISYQEYGSGGPVLFLQKGKPATDIGNWSYVDSSMKGIYATADLMWSVKVHKNIDFEYGAGFGVGVIFGDLVTNWVSRNAGAAYAGGPTINSSQYGTFYGCSQRGPVGSGCNAADHSNSSVDKVGGYTEPSWFNGGSKPNFFPWIGIPQLGLRFKPIKAMEARLQIGFSLTGFWFGLSADYGFEKPAEKAPK